MDHIIKISKHSANFSISSSNPHLEPSARTATLNNGGQTEQNVYSSPSCLEPFQQKQGEEEMFHSLPRRRRRAKREFARSDGGMARLLWISGNKGICPLILSLAKYPCKPSVHQKVVKEVHLATIAALKVFTERTNYPAPLFIIISRATITK